MEYKSASLALRHAVHWTKLNNAITTCVCVTQHPLIAVPQMSGIYHRDRGGDVSAARASSIRSLGSSLDYLGLVLGGHGCRRLVLQLLQLCKESTSASFDGLPRLVQDRVIACGHRGHL